MYRCSRPCSCARRCKTQRTNHDDPTTSYLLPLPPSRPRFLYTGEIVLTIETVWPFYCFVNTYQVTDLVDSVEDIMDKAVSVETCCTLLCSAQQLGSYDHYALRKCLNMLLMDFPEVSETPGFLSLDYDVLAAVVSSDELNAAEECVFEACMNWIAADEQVLGAGTVVCEDLRRLLWNDDLHEEHDDRMVAL